jgi:hypothetical protein
MKTVKVDMSRKKNLRSLVEDYMERDYSQLQTLYKDHRIQALSAFANIFQLLCDPTDNVEANDLTPGQLKDTILEWNLILIPVWKKIRGAFLDFRKQVIPRKEKHRKMITSLNDPTSPLAQYRDTVSNYPLTTAEKTYTIKLKRSPITINLSFDSDKFSISMEGIRVVDRLLLQLKDAPVDIFSVCDHCGKIIIITRMGKRYHSGCASKAKQKELWTKDPEGCKRKERNRYRQRVRGERDGQRENTSEEKTR